MNLRLIGKVALAATFSIFLTACDSKTAPTPENFTATINAYFVDHPDCLLDGSVRFPYETSDAAEVKRMDALAAAQVLEGKQDPSVRVTRYTLTPTGTHAGPRLCFGHRMVTSIVSSTPPALANGITESVVTYGYKMEDTPVWAKSAAVQAAFPKMAAATSGSATDKITLAQNKVNWVVP